jgi:hypothetical protein
MKHTTNPINVRIEWCRRQIAQARTEPEMDGWRAEEDGLRDALINRDHTDDYRLCPPEIRERYVLGFQDGSALLRAARIERVIHAAITEAPQSATWMGQDGRRRDEQ